MADVGIASRGEAAGARGAVVVPAGDTGGITDNIGISAADETEIINNGIGIESGSEDDGKVVNTSSDDTAYDGVRNDITRITTDDIHAFGKAAEKTPAGPGGVLQLQAAHIVGSQAEWTVIGGSEKIARPRA